MRNVVRPCLHLQLDAWNKLKHTSHGLPTVSLDILQQLASLLLFHFYSPLHWDEGSVLTKLDWQKQKGQSILTQPAHFITLLHLLPLKPISCKPLSQNELLCWQMSQLMVIFTTAVLNNHFFLSSQQETMCLSSVHTTSIMVTFKGTPLICALFPTDHRGPAITMSTFVATVPQVPNTSTIQEYLNQQNEKAYLHGANLNKLRTFCIALQRLKQQFIRDKD